MDLKSIRKLHLSLTQRHLAGHLGVSVARLRGWERCPEALPSSVLVSLMRLSSLSLERLLSHGDPSPLTTDWHCRSRRPLLAFCGPPDAGKTTLINQLSGAHLQASWTPTTAIPVFLKHLSRKPRWLHRDGLLLRRARPSEAAWDHQLHHERGYMRSWTLQTCDLGSLRRTSTRRGVQDAPANNRPGGAVFYLGSALLRVCDMLDLPGVNSGDRLEDDEWARWGARQADQLIYVSPAAAFLRGDDIAFLRSVLSDAQAAPKQLLVVASQAHMVDGGSQPALESILARGRQRLMEALGPNGRITAPAPDQFTAYSAGWPDLRGPFEHKLLSILRAYNEAAPSV